RFDTSAGNHIKEILLKLNLLDLRILKDGGEGPTRSDEMLKLKNFKKDALLKISSQIKKVKDTSQSLKSMITTPYSQENEKKKEVYEHKNEDLHSML
nr:hypothetical protein [Tanacetum cinerariifolium]